MDVHNVATHIIDIAALLCLAWLLSSSTAVQSRRKTPLLIGILLTVVIIVAEVGTIVAAQAGAEFRFLNQACNLIGFSLTPLVPLAVSFMFDSGVLRRYNLLIVPTLLNGVATGLSPVTGSVFYIDAANHYSRGSHFYMFVAVYCLNLLVLAVTTLEAGKRFNYRLGTRIAVLLLFACIGTSLQVLYPFAYASWHCVTLALFLYFLLVSEFDSSFDSLTGLYNRAAFDKAAHSMGEADGFSIIVLDIDDFKQVNDTHGHAHGDAVIRTVAEVVRNEFGRDCTCYRCGGDEFYIIGRETDPYRVEEHLASMVRALAAAREEESSLPTVSYGYSISQKGEPSHFQEMLQDADDQMYRFKKAHKGGGD